MVWNLVVLVVIGVTAGLIARTVISEKQSLSVLETVVLGLMGSLVGNLLVGLVSGRGFEPGTAGWIGSILGVVVALGILVGVTGRRGVRSW